MITNGKITYERVVKDGDYGINRKAIVELSFGNPDGDVTADQITTVSNKAISVVNEMLGQSAAKALEPLVTVKAEELTLEQAHAIMTAKASRRGPLTEIEKAARKIVEGEQNKVASTLAAISSRSLDAAVTVAAQIVGAEAAAKAEAEVEAEWEADVGVEVVTDAALNEAVTMKNKVLQDPPKIKKLIAEFKPASFGDKIFNLRDMPQESRAEFIRKLAALSKG